MNKLTSLTLFDIIQRGTSPLYAIIDVMCYPALPEFWQMFQPAAAPLWRQLRFTPDAGEWQRWAPIIVLVEEGKSGETLLRWIAETQSMRPPGITLLHSVLSLDEITRYWQQRIACIYPDGTKALFRGYNPDLLRLWWATLNEMGQSAFLSPHDSFYLSLKEDERLVYSMFGAENNCSIEQSDYYIHLNREQYYLLSNESRLHQLANQLWLYASTLYIYPLDIEIVKTKFISGIALARQLYPYAHDNECESWSAHRWVLGSDFYLHPRFITLLERNNLENSIRLFKAQPHSVQDVREYYHRPGWMRGELPDISEVKL
ncbi:hypothetical protein B4923_20375 [Brenneria roseae subsp. americana]|uniref:DUF4123 domain-containing protein n=1 Tax=Brenneria roseae subsp. americana TaxID=1508507 RepID=A0A2U1TIP0_9GAMM|nr:DUF4123 domain-containing protein [Brenneria roseae]PWC09286.1 hypothetical protein B4923_20375 [Brenneria roseae subsp. americana]